MQCCLSSPAAEDLKELQAMLSELTAHSDSSSDIRAVRQAIADLRSGASARRAQQLQQQRGRVVGVTTAAARFPLLQGQVFGVVVVDEASQMHEPQTVDPLLRFAAQRLVCCLCCVLFVCGCVVVFVVVIAVIYWLSDVARLLSVSQL